MATLATRRLGAVAVMGVLDARGLARRFGALVALRSAMLVLAALGVAILGLAMRAPLLMLLISSATVTWPASRRFPRPG